DARTMAFDEPLDVEPHLLEFGVGEFHTDRIATAVHRELQHETVPISRSRRTLGSRGNVSRLSIRRSSRVGVGYSIGGRSRHVSCLLAWMRSIHLLASCVVSGGFRSYSSVSARPSGMSPLLQYDAYAESRRSA